jgi:hypothetical protein
MKRLLYQTSNILMGAITGHLLAHAYMGTDPNPYWLPIALTTVFFRLSRTENFLPPY